MFMGCFVSNSSAISIYRVTLRSLAAPLSSAHAYVQKGGALVRDYQESNNHK